MLQSMGSQRVRHDLAAEQQQHICIIYVLYIYAYHRIYNTYDTHINYILRLEGSIPTF